jgi:hypothetical protein
MGIRAITVNRVAWRDVCNMALRVT